MRSVALKAAMAYLPHNWDCHARRGGVSVFALKACLPVRLGWHRLNSRLPHDRTRKASKVPIEVFA